MKIHLQTARSSSRTPSRLGWLFLIPLLALTPLAQATGPEISIQNTGDTDAVIIWPDPASEYIVLWAMTLDGPWTPCLESIDRGTNLCQMAVACTGERKYFKLAKGQRFEETDWDLGGWTVTYWDDRVPSYLTWEATNGQLRVHGYWPGTGFNRMVCFHRTDLMLTDFSLSLDILGWDEVYPEDIPNIVLLGRLDPSFVRPPNAYAYSGGVGMRQGGSLTNSCVWLWEHDHGGSYGGFVGSLQTIEKTDPAKDYRLQLHCVGTELTVKLFNLTDGILAAEYTALDHTYTNGWVGFYVREAGPSGTVDFWLDNFVAVGTTP